jgi:hypothetical protein
MNMRRTLIVINLFYLVLLVSCKHAPTVAPAVVQAPSSSACDTGNVTYSITIHKDLSDNCLRCHGSSVYNFSGGGYNFDDYTVIAAQANNGNLAKAINHAPGVIAMPTDQSAKISDCDIRKFMIWIAAGAPHN